MSNSINCKELKPIIIITRVSLSISVGAPFFTFVEIRFRSLDPALSPRRLFLDPATCVSVQTQTAGANATVSSVYLSDRLSTYIYTIRKSMRQLQY